MERIEEDAIPVLLHAEPVLAVDDVASSVTYWHEILGFPQHWTWGQPPNHGGVSWDGVFIQFSLNPAQASASKGSYVWIRVRNLERLYEIHQNKNATIVAPLEDKPWGMTEYAIRDLNGYYVYFSGPSSTKIQSSSSTPAKVRILRRRPSPEEYRFLSNAVGWGGGGSDEMLQSILYAPVFSLVAEDIATNKVIGCVLLLGDNASFYYVKDLMVHPNWQRQRIGTMLMNELNKWLEQHAPENTRVGLYTGEGLTDFYRKFGFSPMFGMNKFVRPR